MRRVCFVSRVSSFATAASFLVAELDLKLVESVLSAIRTADLTSALEKKPPLPIVQHPLPAAPARVYKDCLVVHRTDQRPAVSRVYSYRRCSPSAGPMPVVIEKVVVQKVADELCSPLAPPWKSLPWNQPPHLPAKIKVVHYRPDICHKGTVLDCFI